MLARATSHLRALPAHLALALLPSLALGAAAWAQTVDLSGTWKLDREASALDPALPYGGLGGNVGTPTMLYVTQARNGTVIVGSNTNTSRARTYRPGGESQAPAPGGSGELLLSSRWDERTLVARGTDPSTRRTLVEKLALSEDGERLTVQIAVGGPDGQNATTMVFERMATELPCREWATPCKRWGNDGRAIDER